MKEYLLILLFAGTIKAWNQVQGTIEEDTKWFFKKLSVHPAMSASIQYSISYPYETSWHRPIITFNYDGQQSNNLDRKCNDDKQGQLCNKNLAVPLDRRNYREKFTCSSSSCTRSGWFKKCQLISCQGKTNIQDFEPKSYSFSLGFECDETNASLKGMQYEVTIEDESNKINCVNLSKVEAERLDNCDINYQYAAIPNQVGDTDLNGAVKTMNRFLNSLGYGHDASSTFRIRNEECRKKVKPFLCGIFLPKCLPEENKIILPCRDTCRSILEKCLPITPREIDVNCDYLPPCPPPTLLILCLIAGACVVVAVIVVIVVIVYYVKWRKKINASSSPPNNNPGQVPEQ